MINTFSAEEYKKTMIVIFVNPHTRYFKSYNLGTKEIIVEKSFSKSFQYGYPLLTYLAVARTILECRRKNLQGFRIFTTSTVARWFDEGECDSSMLYKCVELKKKVLEIESKIYTEPLPEIMIWNDKWGIISINLDGHYFDLRHEDIFKYTRYSYNPTKKKVKKKKSGQTPPFGYPFEW